MDNKIEIKDYYVMLNLHKALLEAKFHTNPDNTYVCSSPIIADLCNELIETMAKIDEERDKRNSGKWDKWRALENQSFYRERAKENAISHKGWINLSDKEKLNFVKNLLCPFVATEEELCEFIAEVDECIK